MPLLLKLLAAVPGVIAGVNSILSVLVKYFPPKSDGDRAIDKLKEQITEVRQVQLDINKQIKEARLGKTKAIEDIINRPN